MSKVGNIKFEKLEMQQYLYKNTNTNSSQCIAKARAKTLDIKTLGNKSWKFDNRTCSGCDKTEESVDDILIFKYGENQVIPAYRWFYENKPRDMIYCVKDDGKK
jgi:hypothetical protein